MNFYGAHYDERGRIDGVDGGPPTQEVGSTIYIDMEARYVFSDSLQITFGLMNAFDSYVDEVKDPYANRLNVGLPYPRRTAANFEGGSWYLKENIVFSIIGNRNQIKPVAGFNTVDKQLCGVLGHL